MTKLTLPLFSISKLNVYITKRNILQFIFKKINIYFVIVVSQGINTLITLHLQFISITRLPRAVPQPLFRFNCFRLHFFLGRLPFTRILSLSSFEWHWVCLPFTRILRLSSIYKKNWGHLPFTNTIEVVFHLRKMEVVIHISSG